MKISIIGAGSTYTPELVEGIIDRQKSLNVSELFFYDIDMEKLNIVGNLCKRMLLKANINIKAVLSDNLDDTLKDANFVLSQIRVGKLDARILDEKIPLEFGILGQETMGVGGFFKAQRTIPVVLDIVKKMEKLCPNSFYINFTNPAGIITQAISDNSFIKTIGLCNVPFNMIKSISEKMNLENPTFDYIGLNHLSWIVGIKDNNVDVFQKAIAEGINSDTMKNIGNSDFSAELIREIKAIPSPYLNYIYNIDEKLKKCYEEELSRGEKCKIIEKELLEKYKDENLNIKPPELAERGGANYSLVAISLIDAIHNDKKEIHIVNCKNSGTVDFLDDKDVIETSCIIDSRGATPIPLQNFNNDNKYDHIVNLMKTFKEYENLTVKSAILKNKELAIQSLCVNPLVKDKDTAIKVFNKLATAHKEFLPYDFL
ncbi:MAG: 6-phospho-beta-glucosidase [Lachnospirales bacterium]